MKKLILALTALALFACSTEEKNTFKGVAIGAATGALAGGVIGHQSGNRDKGALAGALLGATAGGFVGHRMDQQAKELEKIAETKRTETGLVTKLKSDILFDSGESDLKPAAQSNLKQMADIMKKYPENVLKIKGYTDSTGSKQLNTTLSLKRADAVKSELVAAGMPADTITTLGEGPNEPLADNKTELGRRQNRRVEVEVTVDQTKVPQKK